MDHVVVVECCIHSQEGGIVYNGMECKEVQRLTGKKLLNLHTFVLTKNNHPALLEFGIDPR
jgi:hypothetical protein